MRIVHYVNQFYAGLGGEEAAGIGPRVLDGTVGPGRLLAQLLSVEQLRAEHLDEYQIVATIACGDDYAASNAAVAEELLGIARAAGAELLVAGPAFGSGRYGLACARLVAAAVAAGLPALASMHPDNPGIPDVGAAPVVAAGATSRQMRPTLQTVAAAIAKLATGAKLTVADGRVARAARIGQLVEQRAAARAVELVLRRLAGDRERTEVPVGGFDVVVPSAPVDKVASATVALATEGAVVPAGNPDRLESARATRWLRYQITGVGSLAAGEWECVDGGFATTAANADPNRILPLDIARTLEREGAIGRLHNEFLVTVGNGTQVATARRFGVEWAAELRKAGVQAAILTAT
jgi:glycine reductase complex component B subunit gamma